MQNNKRQLGNAPPMQWLHLISNLATDYIQRRRGEPSLATLLTADIIKWQKCARMGLNGFHIK